MSDRWVLALAAAAALGAARPGSVPLWLGVLVVVGALLARAPAVLCVGAALLVSSLAARSLAGLDGVRAEQVAGEVTLLSDPAPAFGGVRADAQVGGRRLELRAEGVSADALRPRLAGERVQIRGHIEPAPADAPWLTARHVAGRLRVHAVESWAPGDPLSRLANGLRRTLVAGATPLSPERRALFTGLVIGDDRAQPVELADDFLGAGLTHLLAVSGQNVAFALTLAGPVLRRLRLWPRLGATLAVVGMFGLMTRFEPSVLRASAMAALATTVLTVSGPVPRLRLLALTVVGLLVVDPLLVRSVGFQLSVAAAGAIIVAARPLADALPGPALLRASLSVTIAAQLGVAPVLLATFGPLPVASLPANLLAVPAAGPVMVWGLTGGVVAGLVGEPVAGLIHLPTRVLLEWLAQVAQRAAGLPLGELRAPHLAALAAGLALAIGARWSGDAGDPHSRPRRVGLAVAAASVAVAVVSAQAPAPLREGLQLGVVRWHARGTDVVVLGGVGGRSQLGPASVLASLREAGVRSVALVVIADASIGPGVIAAIAARHRVGAVVIAAGAQPPEVATPVAVVRRPQEVIEVGALEVRVTTTADRLVVDARPRGPPGRAPGWPR